MNEDRVIRVRVVSDNPSLTIGLSVSHADLEIDGDGGIDTPAVDADVVVVDVHGPEPDLTRLGDVPVIVITSDPHVDEAESDRVARLCRPCSLEDLTRHVRMLATNDESHSDPAPEPIESRWAEAAGEEPDAAASSTLGRRFRSVLPGNGVPPGGPVDEELSLPDPTAGPESEDVAWPEDERPRAATPGGQPPQGDDLGAPEPMHADLWPDPSTSADRDPRVLETPADPDTEPDREVEATGEPGTDGLAEPGDPDEAFDPRPATPAIHRRPAAPRPTAGAGDRPSPPAAAPLRRLGRRARRRSSGGDRGDDLRTRLGRTLLGAADLEALLDDLPALRDIAKVAAIVVDEVHGALATDTAALWRPADDGWHALAHQGLTRTERAMVVPFDQPLFHEVDDTGGGVLIHPIDVVPEAVAGIGGAHTHAVAAVALAAGTGRYGILCIGRDDPLTDRDLDVLGAHAEEALPALAIADLVARLASRAVAPSGPPATPPSDMVVDVTDGLTV